MIIKSFEGHSVQDAMKKVKKELGPQAIIISTKEKSMGDDKKSKIVEIKAAIPEASKIEGATAIDSAQTTSSFQKMQERLESMDHKLSHFIKTSAQKTQVSFVEEKIKELKLLFLENMKQQDSHSMLNSLPPHISQIYQDLVLSGIHHKFLTPLTQHLLSLNTLGSELEKFNSFEDFYRAHSIRWMAKKIRVTNVLSSEKASPTFHAFVGPCGGGKTTSLLKIAAYLKKNKNMNLALATFENIRFASTDALRVFAKIIDVPLLIATDYTDLKEKISKNQNYDTILLDCPGDFPHLAQEIYTFKDELLSAFPMDVHLVLPLTTKDDYLEQAITHFSPLSLQSLVFTKLDESLSYGDIFNISAKWSLPLSFFMNGSKIPDGIEQASREGLLEKIFRITSIS